MSYLTTVTGSYPRKEVQKDTLRKPTVSEEDSFETELRKPPSRREIGEVKRVADQLRKISRPEEQIVLHPKPR